MAMIQDSQLSGYYDTYEDRGETTVFNPIDFIKPLEDGFALCTNPMVDGGVSAITVNTRLSGEPLRNFEASVKRMVLAKLFSPKFAEVILTATALDRRH